MMFVFSLVAQRSSCRNHQPRSSKDEVADRREERRSRLFSPLNGQKEGPRRVVGARQALAQTTRGFRGLALRKSCEESRVFVFLFLFDLRALGLLIIECPAFGRFLHLARSKRCVVRTAFGVLKRL